MSEFVNVDQYTALKLEDGGQYGFKLVEGWIGREGDFKPNFCSREFKKGSGEKKVPVSVKLGNIESAATILSDLLEQVNGLRHKNDKTDQDVPF